MRVTTRLHQVFSQTAGPKDVSKLFEEAGQWMADEV